MERALINRTCEREVAHGSASLGTRTPSFRGSGTRRGYERMFYRSGVPGLTREQRHAMARALIRAAEHFEARAQAIDHQAAGWRKGRPGDSSPVVAETLHGAARELRKWADQCASPQC